MAFLGRIQILHGPNCLLEVALDCAWSLGVTTLVYFYQSDRNSSRVLLKKPDMVFWCDTQQGEGGICL